MKDIEFSTVDRIEGNMVIIELPDKQTISVEKSVMPSRIKQGDKVYKDEAGIWIVDKKKTEDEKKRIRNLMDSLFE